MPSAIPLILFLIWSGPPVPQSYAEPPTSEIDPLYEELNALERQTIDEVLEEIGGSVCSPPASAVFGEARVINLEVLRTGTFIDWFNLFHATTRPQLVLDELLWSQGAQWDREIVRETGRNLRERVNFSVVAIVPLCTSQPDRVDLLVVTADTWSLRLGTQLNITDGVVNRLFLSLTEQNLLGLHKTISASSLYEQDTLKLGPTYYDPRLFRTRLELYEQFLFAVNHDTWDIEGTENTFSFGLPLYQLESRWGFQLSESHGIGINRLFVGDQPRTYDDPDTDAVEALPFEVRQSVIDADVRGLYRTGDSFKHDLAFGWGLSSQHYEIAHNQGSAATRAAFGREFLPRSELASFLQASSFCFRPTYVTERNYNTFAFSEDIRTGPEVFATIDAAPRFLGSDTDFLRSSLRVGFTHAPGGSILHASAQVGARLELADGDFIDRFVLGRVRIASPQWGPIRVHIHADAHVAFNRVTSGVSTLGGDNGLRGYSSGLFIGESTVLGHLEIRTAPLEILTQYIGLVAFFDAGTIFDEGESPPFLSDVGVGIRWVAPQLQRIAYRLDYAFPTSGPDTFFPGVFTFGLGQVF